jgi:hypothetical protein
VHSFRGLGDASTPTTPIQQALPTVLKTAQTLLESDDAYENAAVIQAKIQNYRKMKAQFPILATFYDNEINKLQAKLTAAQRQTTLQAETEQATRDWRTVGYAIGIGAAVLTVAATVRLLRR